MFPSLNPTAHLILRWSSFLKLCCEEHMSYGSASQTGQQHAQILTRGLRNCLQTDNHEMSSYAAWFVLEEKNLAFLKSAQPISPKLSASLFLYAIESWESPSALPDNQKTEESDTSSPPRSISFSQTFLYSSFACHEYDIFIDSWLIKSNSSNRVEECFRINVCINGSQTFSRVPHEIRLQPWLMFPEPQRGVWKYSQREKLFKVYMKPCQKV